MLEGKNIKLKLFTEDDLKEFVQLENVYVEQTEFLPPTLHSLMTRQKDFEETKGWWDEHRGGLVIADKTDRMLGAIGFFRRNPGEAGYEIGYGLLRRDDRGRGYGTESLRIFSAYMFELKPIPRLQILTAAGNTPSRRIAEKCGYQYEGTLRKCCYLRGDHVDVVIYSLLREECMPLTEALRQ